MDRKQNNFSFKDFFSLINQFQIISPVIIISQFFNELSKTSGSTQRINEMLNEPEEIAQDEQNVDITNKELKFEHVDFSYKDGKPILHDINVQAKPNTVVAFAGPSGGGKSTIFSLIERFYKPTAGEITIGGENIDEISLEN